MLVAGSSTSTLLEEHVYSLYRIAVEAEDSIISSTIVLNTACTAVACTTLEPGVDSGCTGLTPACATFRVLMQIEMLALSRSAFAC